jgi:hypothetical protein
MPWRILCVFKGEIWGYIFLYYFFWRGLEIAGRSSLSDSLWENSWLCDSLSQILLSSNSLRESSFLFFLYSAGEASCGSVYYRSIEGGSYINKASARTLLNAMGFQLVKGFFKRACRRHRMKQLHSTTLRSQWNRDFQIRWLCFRCVIRNFRNWFAMSAPFI